MQKEAEKKKVKRLGMEAKRMVEMDGIKGTNGSTNALSCTVRYWK